MSVKEKAAYLVILGLFCVMVLITDLVYGGF